MTSILTVCVVLSLGQAGTSPEISEFLRQSPEAQFLAEVVSDFPIGGCARLNRVALDLVLPSLGWRPDLDRCGQVKIITEEDLVGLVLKPETLESLIPEGAAENELREMLARLGTEKARQFRIDVAFLPPLALEAAGGNDAPQLAEELDPDQFEAILTAAGDAVHRVSLVASNEQLVHASTGRQRSTHARDEVNQTGLSPVSNPVIESVPLGFTVEAQTHAPIASPLAEVRLGVWKTAETDKAQTRNGHYSQHEVITLEERSLETRIILPLGKAVVAGSFVDASQGGEDRCFAVLARVEEIGPHIPRPGGLKLVEAGGLELRAFDVGCLRQGGRHGEGTPPLDEQARAEVAPESWEDSSSALLLSHSYLFAKAPSAVQEKLATWVSTRNREALRSVRLEMQVLEGPIARLLELRRRVESGVFLPPKALDDEATRGLEKTYRAILRAVRGGEARLRGVRVRSYVRDLTLASGACFRMPEMPDESVLLGGDGFEGSFSFSDPGLSAALRVKIDWIRTRTHFERQVPHRFYPSKPVQIVSPGDTPKDVEQPSTAGGVVLAKPASFPIDLPEGDAMRSSLDTLLDPDRWAILKLESTTPGRGRMLLARTSSSMQEAGSAQPGTPDRPLSVASLGPATEHATLRLPTLRNATALVIGLEEDVTGSFAAPTPTAWQPDWGFLEEKLSQDATRAEAAAQMQRVELQSMRCVFVEVAIVSLASVPEKDLRASPWLPGEVFDAACVASNPPGEVAAANCPLGGQLRLLPRGVRLQLTDQQVSQTGFFPVVEPSVACLPDGNFVEATVHGTPDPSLFRVDLRVDRHRLEPEIERRSLPDGDIELAKGTSQVFATSLITPPRKTVVVGLARPAQGSDSKGFLLLLRVTPEGRDAGSATQAPIECIDIGALTKPFPHVQVWENPFGVNGEDLSPIMPNEDAPGPVSEAQLSAALHSVQGPSGSNWANVGHFILAESVPGTERRARDSLAAFSRDTLRPYVIELWQGSMKPSALEPLTNGRARVEDWLEIMQREGLHVRALVTAGASSAVADFAARAYAADLNRVTGGSIDAVIEVGDIEMRTVSEGLALDLQCDPLPGMDAVQLSVLGELSRNARIERTTRTRNPRVYDASRQPEKNSTDAIPDWIQIDLPDNDSDRWRHIGPVPLGKPFLLQALPDPADPRLVRPIVVIVTAVKP